MNETTTNGRAGQAVPMLCLEDVTKVYRTERIETLALDGVRLEVEKGEFLAIMGPSGCGKSTLLNLAGLLDAPSRGRVLLDGEDVGRHGDRKLSALRNRKIGFIFQQFHLISDLPVIDNVEIPLLYRRGDDGRGLSHRERRRAALAALDRVGLSSRVHHLPGQLSGGQQQRVAIARAIAGRPALLLADEPTGNLDSQMGDEILEIVEELHDEGTTVLMVTHDARQAGKADRTIRLFDGRPVS